MSTNVSINEYVTCRRYKSYSFSSKNVFINDSMKLSWDFVTLSEQNNEKKGM